MRHYHVLQHVAYEGIGAIRSWIDGQKCRLDSTRFWRSDWKLPDPDSVDGLIIMGGPMGVYDDNDFEWLPEEKDFIRAYLALERPTLGICLGAQLLADALGALVLPQSHKEIGFFPIHNTPETADSLLDHIPDAMPVFHWHGDTFELPTDARWLKKSEACEQQAFQFGEHVLGLQFHLEATTQELELMREHGRKEIQAGGPFVQDSVAIERGEIHLQDMHDALKHTLDRLFKA